MTKKKQVKKNTKDTAKKDGKKEEALMCAGCLKVYQTKQGLDRHQPGCLENLAKAHCGRHRRGKHKRVLATVSLPALPPQQSQLAHAAALMAADPYTAPEAGYGGMATEHERTKLCTWSIVVGQLSVVEDRDSNPKPR